MKCVFRTNSLLGKAFAYSINYIQVVQKLLALFRMHNSLRSSAGRSGSFEEAEAPTFLTFYGLLRCLKTRHDITNGSPIRVCGSQRQSNRLLFSKEISLLKCMLKIHSPLLYKQLKKICVPLEALIYDHVTSLFSLTFPTETVFRIWDILFLEINSPHRKYDIL